MKHLKNNLQAPYTSSPKEDFHQSITLPSSCISHLAQNWLPQIEESFQPTHAWVKWNEHGLYIYAVLHDRDIFNPANQFNDFSYTQGDTFEIFIRPDETDAYFEIHITPSNLVTQLKFNHPSEIQSIRKSPHPERLLLSHLFATPRIETMAVIENGRWRIFTALPFALFANAPKKIKNSLWNYSFCRYDYSQNQPAPTLSSSSHLTRLDFHRTEEWKTLELS